MDDANLNRRQTLRVGPSVAFAQIGIIGFDGTIDLAALRLYGLPEATPLIVNGTPTLPLSGQRVLAVETTVDLPNLGPGAEHLFDVTVSGARLGDQVAVSLATSSRFVQVAGHVWTDNTVRVVARNVSGFSVDLAAATLAVEVGKRRLPRGRAPVPAERGAAAHAAPLPICSKLRKQPAGPKVAGLVGTSGFAAIPPPPSIRPSCGVSSGPRAFGSGRLSHRP